MVYKWIIEKRSAAVAYKLGSIIRNYILDSKNIVNSIYIDEEVSFRLNIDLCVSEKSNFTIHIRNMSKHEAWDS